MKGLLHHLFFPQESNNHRSKLLHNQILLFAVIILLSLNVFVSFGKTNFSRVLGVSININNDELLSLTNKERQEKGLTQLKLNNELSKAASLKASDMMEKNYWAHNSPVGDTPWIFFKKVNYDYVYAGENLARGFTKSDEIVNAWMKSPSHRENMLSPNYTEIGFAVTQGKLLGEDTTLVVELFGSRPGILAEKQESPPTKEITAVNIPQTSVASLKTSSFIDANALTKNSTLIILALFIAVFIIDMIIIEKKKIIRLVGHNLDHIFFLGIIIVFVVLFSKGAIL